MTTMIDDSDVVGADKDETYDLANTIDIYIY